MRAARRKTTEFSKKILMVAGAINLVVIVFTMIVVWRTLDLSPLAYLIPSVAAEVATGTAFYYTKAKLENKIKLMSQLEVPVDRDTFND